MFILHCFFIQFSDGVKNSAKTASSKDTKKGSGKLSRPKRETDSNSVSQNYDSELLETLANEHDAAGLEEYFLNRDNAAVNNAVNPEASVPASEVSDPDMYSKLYPGLLPKDNRNEFPQQVITQFNSDQERFESLRSVDRSRDQNENALGNRIVRSAGENDFFNENTNDDFVAKATDSIKSTKDEILQSPPRADLPVMVFIHGGSYFCNAGRLYPGEKLASTGMVVVTLNYRLGAFGES